MSTLQQQPVRAALAGALRAMFVGALFVSVVGVVSCGISYVPGSDSFEDAMLSLFVGTVVFHFLGALLVVAGALWGLISIPLLSISGLKRRANGVVQVVLAGSMGLLSGIVAGYVMGASVLEEPLFHVSSALIGLASRPFIAWAAGWDRVGAKNIGVTA